MPSWLELLQQLQSEYDPDLPGDVPKPPGYWAAKQFADNGLLSLPGIGLGILGSGLQKYTEEVPRRIAYGRAKLEENPLLRGLSNAAPIPLDISGAYRKAVREGKNKDEAIEAVNPLEAMYIESVNDPINALGGWTKNVPGVVGKVLQGIERGANIPGEKAVQGLGAGAGLVKKGVDKAFPSLKMFDQSPKSEAAQLTGRLKDVVAHRPGLLKGIVDPLSIEGQYAIPMLRGGKVNSRTATKIVNNQWNELEKIVLDTATPLEKTWKMALLHNAKTSTAEFRDWLGGQMGKGELDDPETVGAWNFWFDQTRRRQDALRDELGRPLPAPFSDIPPTDSEALGLPHDIMKPMQEGATIVHDEWIKVIEDSVNQVKAINQQVASQQISKESGNALRNSIYHQRNLQVASLQRQLWDYMRSTLGEDALGTDASKAFLNRLEDYQQQVFDPTGGMGFLSDKDRGAYERMAPIFEPQVLKVVADKQRLARLVLDGFQGSNRPKSMSEAWSRVGAVLGREVPAWSELDTPTFLKGLQEAYALRPNLISPEAVRKVQQLVAKYEGMDILSPTAPLDIALPKSQMAMTEALGGKPYKFPPTFMDNAKKMYSTSTRVAAENMILTPGFVGALNPITAIGNAGLYNPQLIPQASKGLWQTMKAIGYGTKRPKPGDNNILPTDVRDFMRDTGLGIPSRVDIGEYANFNYDVVSKTRLAAEGVNPVVRGAIGAVTAAGDPITAVLNAGYGVLSGTGYKYNPQLMMKNVMGAEEAAIRSTMWQFGGKEKLLEQLPDFLKQVKDRLSVQRTRMDAVPGFTMSIPATPAAFPVSPKQPTESLTSYLKRLTGYISSTMDTGTPRPWFLDGRYIHNKTLRSTISHAEEYIKGLAPPTTPSSTIIGPADQVGELPIGVWNDPSKIRSITEQIQATNGLLSKESLQDILEEAGVLSDDVSAIVGEWVNVLDTASEYGADIADKFQVDYSNFTNFEDFLGAFYPFLKWPTHMLNVVGKAILETPAAILFLNRLNSLTEEEADELGLPDKYKQSIRTGNKEGLGHKVASMLLRRDVTPMVDFSRMIPYAGYTPDVGNAKFAQGPVEAAYDLMPLQPYPQVSLPLQALSAGLSQVDALKPYVLSPERPLPSVNRMSGFLNLLSNMARGIPGVDEMLPRAGGAERGLQQLVESLPGDVWRPYSFERGQVHRRIGELGGEETGYVDHPLYQAAKGREEGDIYERAKSDVLRTRGLEGTLSTLLPFTTRFLGDTEEKVYGAQRHIPGGPKDTTEKVAAYTKALGEAPEASMHQDVAGTDLDTKINYVIAVKHNPALLFPDAAPAVATELTKALNKYENYQGTPGAKNPLIENPLVAVALRKQQEFNQQDPIAAAYDYWRANVHPGRREEGEEALRRQFKAWYTKNRQ